MINQLYGTSIIAALVISMAGLISPVLAAPAIHIDKNGCTMGDGDGNVVSPSDAKVRQVETQSANNNIVYICTADVQNTSGHAVKYDSQNNPVAPGLQCGSVDFEDATTDWKEIISASGNAKLICHFKS